jgi:hypothetical protein
MFEQFSSSGAGTAERAPQPGVTTPQTPPPVAQTTVREPAATASPDGRTAQYEKFGGVNGGAAFFGWLVAIGLSVILVALASAAGAAVGLSSSPGAALEAAETVGLVGGIVLVAILMVGYCCGGYVVGRMSRLDGGAPGGGGVDRRAGRHDRARDRRRDPRRRVQRAQPPRPAANPIDEGTLTTGGLVTLAAVVVGTLLAAVTGGKAGQRYQRRVDRAAGG